MGIRGGRRRLLMALLAVEVVVLLAAAGVWLVMRQDDAKENVLNDGLRGSRPPAGQHMPPLNDVKSITPPVPRQQEFEGSAVQLIATCLDCTSGEIIGGYLGRLTRDDIPAGARVLVVGWDGDVEAWQRRWRVDDELVDVHVTNHPGMTRFLRELFGIAPRGGAEESGITFLYDTRGRWRSTYFLGQLDREDVAHDLRVLSH